MYIGLTCFCLLIATLFGHKHKRHTPTRQIMLEILRTENSGIITFKPTDQIDLDYIQYMVEARLLMEIGHELFITRSGSDLRDNA